MIGTTITLNAFRELARRQLATPLPPDAAVLIPVGVRLLSDQLTPVLAYRRLVAEDERKAPSFLFESVEGGERVGRYSIMGAQPATEVTARGTNIRISHPGTGPNSHVLRRAVSARQADAAPSDPFAVLKQLTSGLRLAVPEPGEGIAPLPDCLLGGWVGYAGYDSVRYVEPSKLGFDSAPLDDRHLPDIDFALYDSVVIFDHVAKLVYVIKLAAVGPNDDPGSAFDAAIHDLEERVRRIETHSRPLRSGVVGMGEARSGAASRAERVAPRSNLTVAQHADMVEAARKYIRAGDVFQVVLGQRFRITSKTDPFDVYRALRTVNPSPYMGYLQGAGCILVASSPEILCRVRREAVTSPASDASLRTTRPAGHEHAPQQRRMIVTNRPLAGTRRRGATREEDASLERELLADEKERAEHIMLVDLGRNDVGKVAEPGSVRLERLMEIERYSHVMHISSTVTGVLQAGLDCWDALRATLPAGTISGAPKIRAMQIIDELEPVRRGPYGGGFGYVSLAGDMDIALALRTIVVMPAEDAGEPPSRWEYYIQAAGGIVHDSQPEAEYQETVNKAAALVRAVELAESAFGPAP